MFSSIFLKYLLTNYIDGPIWLANINDFVFVKNLKDKMENKEFKL